MEIHALHIAKHLWVSLNHPNKINQTCCTKNTSTHTKTQNLTFRFARVSRNVYLFSARTTRRFSPPSPRHRHPNPRTAFFAFLLYFWVALAVVVVDSLLRVEELVTVATEKPPLASAWQQPECQTLCACCCCSVWHRFFRRSKWSPGGILGTSRTAGSVAVA